MCTIKLWNFTTILLNTYTQIRQTRKYNLIEMLCFVKTKLSKCIKKSFIEVILNRNNYYVDSKKVTYERSLF